MRRLGRITATAALLAMFIPPIAVHAQGRTSPFRRAVHPCGPLVVATHPWINHIDGTAHERGTHWLLEWEGSVGSCQFSAQLIRSVLRRSDGIFAFLHGHAGIRGGTCRWFEGNGHERITPFQNIDCRTTYSSKRRQYPIRVVAFVDPDPAFITPDRQKTRAMTRQAFSHHARTRSASLIGGPPPTHEIQPMSSGSQSERTTR